MNCGTYKSNSSSNLRVTLNDDCATGTISWSSMAPMGHYKWTYEFRYDNSFPQCQLCVTEKVKTHYRGPREVNGDVRESKPFSAEEDDAPPLLLMMESVDYSNKTFRLSGSELPGGKEVIVRLSPSE